MLNIGNIYSFEVYPRAVLNRNFQNLKLISIMSWDQAVREADVEALHVATFPYMPDGTVNNFKTPIYYKFASDTGNVIVAETWIKPSTVKLIEAKTYNISIVIKNPTYLDTLRVALIKNGFTEFDIREVST